MTISQKYMTRAGIMVSMLIMLPNLKGQDITVSMNTYAGQTDNLFESNSIESQSYINGALSIGYQLSDYTRINGTIYRSEILTNSDYSMGNFQVGIQFRNLDIKKQQWYGGFSLSTNFYSPVYDYYESSTFSGYGNFKYYYSKQGFVNFGYNLKAKSFVDVPQASNSEHVLYAIINKSFSTGTGLNITGRFGAQDFWAPPVEMSRGRYNVVQSTYEELLSNYLAGAEVRLSQSIHPRIGIMVLGKMQYRLNRYTDIFSILDGLTNPFVDYYRWDGSSLYAKITTMLPGNIIMRFSSSIGVKYYLDVPIYEYDFEENTYVLDENDEYIIQSIDRSDEQVNYQVQLSKDWYLKRISGLDTIGTTLTIGWKENQSDDPLYDYAGSMVNLGVNITY